MLSNGQKQYYKERATERMHKSTIENEIVKFICSNDIDGYEHCYDRVKKQEYLQLFQGDTKVFSFYGCYQGLEVLKRLQDKSKYADMSFQELVHIADNLQKRGVL